MENNESQKNLIIKNEQPETKLSFYQFLKQRIDVFLCLSGFSILICFVVFFAGYFKTTSDQLVNKSELILSDLGYLSYKSSNAFVDIEVIKSKLANISVLISKIIPNNTISSTINS